MGEAVVIARANDGHVIGVPGGMLEQVGDFDSRLAALLECAPCAEKGLFVVLRELKFELPETRRRQLAVELVEQRLWVERIEVAGPAMHEEKNDALGLGWKVPRFGGEWIRGA